MSRLLEELIHSLGTVVIRYHDFQKDVIVCVKESDQKSAAFKKAARDYAIKLLQVSDFEQEFDKLNIECTKDYKPRFDFLDFIKKELMVLKKLLDQEAPFSASALDEYKQKIAQLFIDLKKLFEVKKSESHQVQIRRFDGKALTTIALNGFLDEGLKTYYNGPICISGIFIKEELLDRFNMLTTTTNEEIKELAAGLCEEHQNVLLAAKLIKIEAQLSQVQIALQENQSTLAGAQLSLKEAQSALEGSQLSLKETQSILEHTQLMLKDTQSELKTALLKIKELELKTKEQQLKIEALETTQAIKELELSKAIEKAVELQKIIDRHNLELEERATSVPPTAQQAQEETSTTTPSVIPNFAHVLYPGLFAFHHNPLARHTGFPFFPQQSPRTASTTQAEPPTSSVDNAKKNSLGMQFNPSADL